MTDEEMARLFIIDKYGLRKDLEIWRIKQDEDLSIDLYAFLAGLEAGRPKWHKLREEYPDAAKLVRVRLMSGMEHICETCYYRPTEDEIGYGNLVINFYELNGEWVDDNDIISWCEVPQYTEVEE